jgi:carbonic anhydrase
VITRPVLRLAVAALIITLAAAACSASVAPRSAPPSATQATPDRSAAGTSGPSTAAGPSPSAAFGAYDWSYEGRTGPEHWAELDPSYYACKYGVTQSPIELAGADERREKDLVFDYRAGPAVVVNDGHTVTAVPQRRDTRERHNTVEVRDIPYNLMQLQFHVPPEHVIYGQEPSAAEVQFIHQHATGAYAIVGAMVVEGTEDNAAWAPYIDVMDAPTTIAGVEVTIDWSKLIPIEPEMDSYRYDGSLTTPPCTERVEWIFFLEPIRLSAAQIARMRAAYDGNARPLQTVGYYRSVTRDLKND